jgi:CBS domain-containing protein
MLGELAPTPTGIHRFLAIFPVGGPCRRTGNTLHGRGLVKVEKILKSKGRSVETIEGDASNAEVIGRLNGPPHIGALIVTDELGQRPFAGALAECDIVRALHKYGAQLLTMRVADVMSRNVPTCSPQDNIARLMRQMAASRYRHLPVVELCELAGVVSIGDVVKARIEDMELETNLLRDLCIVRG